MYCAKEIVDRGATFDQHHSGDCMKAENRRRLRVINGETGEFVLDDNHR